MNHRTLKAKIHNVNQKFYGVDLKNLYSESGKLISKEVLHLYPNTKTFTVLCGLEGNGLDGLSTAINLLKSGLNVYVYIFGRVHLSSTQLFKDLYTQLEELKKTNSNLHLKQDCYSKDIKNIEDGIILEALVGTGIEGEVLNKRYIDVINRITHFGVDIVAIDLGCPNYTPKYTISLNYPKVDNAIVINIKDELDTSLLCGPGEVQNLFIAKSKTHKQKNGKLLYICSSNNLDLYKTLENLTKQYSVAIKVYNFNNNLNNKINGLVDDSEFLKEFNESDAVLIDNIDLSLFINKSIFNSIINLSKLKPLVINSNIFKEDILENLTQYKDLKNSIFIVERSKIDSDLRKSKLSERSLSKNLNTNLFIYGLQNALYSNEFDYKLSINQGITSNIDLFTAISAVLLTKNPPFLSLSAGVFLFEICNKLSGENKNLAEDNLKEAIELCKDFS